MAVDAGTVYSEVRIELNKLRADIASMNSQFKKFSTTNQAESTAVKTSWTNSFSKINLSGVAAFAGVGIAVKKSISIFTDFEQSMANVQSVARGTEEEFELLEAAAQSAGETTAFTASEAADALYALASAGLSATESAEALDGVLKLAGATQADLASTSATVTATLSQFGLDASEATDVSNVFASAIANSQANMEKLSASMRYVGPVAGTLGMSLEETTGDLQALYDAGFKGEQAGTALRTIFSSLADETSATSTKLDALGVSLEDLNPEVNTTAEIIGTLNDAGLSTGETIAAFGTEAGPALLSLLQVGQEGLEEYTDAVTGTDAAAEAYAIQMDTTKGALAELTSAVQANAISFTSEFEPALRVGISVLTDIARLFNAIPGPIKIFLGIVAAGVPIIGGATIAVTAFSTALASALGPITLVVAGIGTLVAGFVAVKSAIDNAKLKEAEEDFGELAENIGVSNEAMVSLIATAKSFGADGSAEISSVITELTSLQTELGLSAEEFQVLVDKAEDLGATSDNIGSTIVAVNELTNDLGLSSDAIDLVSYSLSTTQYNAENAALHVKDIASNAGLTEEAVIKIGLASADLTDEYRDQLQVLLDQQPIHEDRSEFERLMEESLQAQALAAQEREDAAVAAAEAEADILEAQREQAALDLTNKYKAGWAEIVSILDGAKTEYEQIEEQIERLSELDWTGSVYEEGKLEAIALLREKLAELAEDEEEEFTDISDQTQDYKDQLLELVGTEEDVIESERNRALEATYASEASAEAIDAQVIAINNLYDAMLDGLDEVDDSWGAKLSSWLSDASDYTSEALSVFTDFTDSLDDLFTASSEAQIEAIEATLEADIEALDERLAAALEAAGLTEETELEALETELAAAIAEGDAETAAELQDDIDRLAITEEYEALETAATEAAAEETAQIEYDAAMASYRLSLAQAVADAASSIVGIWADWGSQPIIAGVLTGISAAATGVEIASIKAAKPELESFATGGLVMPSAGGTEIRVAENGSSEYMLNSGASGEAEIDKFAQKIVAAMGGSSAGVLNATIQLYTDRKYQSEYTVSLINNGKIKVNI